MAIISNLLSLVLVALFFAWIIIHDQNKPVTEDLVRSFIDYECSSPNQAGELAQKAVKHLSDMREAGEITYIEYRNRNNILSGGLSKWSSNQNLEDYCAAIWNSMQ